MSTVLQALGVLGFVLAVVAISVVGLMWWLAERSPLMEMAPCTGNCCQGRACDCCSDMDAALDTEPAVHAELLPNPLRPLC